MHDYKMFYTMCAGSLCLFIWGMLIEQFGGFSAYTGWSLTCIIFGIILDAIVSLAVEERYYSPLTQTDVVFSSFFALR